MSDVGDEAWRLVDQTGTKSADTMPIDMAGHSPVTPKRPSIEDALPIVTMWLGSRMRTGRYTPGLARELAMHVVAGSYNVFSILNEIGLLEELSPHLSRSKRASRFTRAPLRGLWKKHHVQAHFILQNIMNEWTRGDSFEKVFRPYYGMTLTTDITGRIARELVHTAYQARASGRRLTGEWIVFDKQPTGNHYLTLARHAEDDRAVFARIRRYRAEAVPPG